MEETEYTAITRRVAMTVSEQQKPKPEVKIRERNKTQGKQTKQNPPSPPTKNTQQITLLAFLYGLELELRTEVSKVPQAVLDAVFQVVCSWGWLHDEGFWESVEGHTSTYPGKRGNCV